MAGDGGEVGDRLERAAVVLLDPAHRRPADRQRALELVVPDHRDGDRGAEAAQRGLRAGRVAAVVVGDEGAAGEQRLAGRALAGLEPDAVPLGRHVVAGGGDAALARVAEVDPGRSAPTASAASRASVRSTSCSSSDMLSARAARTSARSWAARAVRRCSASRRGEAGGGDLRERLGVGDLVGVERPRGVREHDRDAPDLVVVRDGHEQGGRGVVRLDQLATDLAGSARVGHVQGRAGGDDERDAGRAALEPHGVAREPGPGDRRLAARRGPARSRADGRCRPRAARAARRSARRPAGQRYAPAPRRGRRGAAGSGRCPAPRREVESSTAWPSLREGLRRRSSAA